MPRLWLPVVGYEGKYSVSNDGLVRGPRKILSPCFNGGYCQVAIIGERSRRLNAYVHRLVAQAFLPNPDDLPEVNHKDCDKSNNHVTNLEWCSRVANVRHYIQHCDGAIPGGLGGRGEDHPQSKLTAQEVLAIRAAREAGGVTYQQLGEMYGVSFTTIQAVISRRSWKHI